MDKSMQDKLKGIGFAVILVIVGISIAVTHIRGGCQDKELKEARRRKAEIKRKAQEDAESKFAEAVKRGEAALTAGRFQEARAAFTEALGVEGYQDDKAKVQAGIVAARIALGEEGAVEEYVKPRFKEMDDQALESVADGGAVPPELSTGVGQADERIKSALPELAKAELQAREEERIRKEKEAREKAEAAKRDAFERKVYFHAKEILWAPANANTDEDKLFARAGKKFGLSGSEVQAIYVRQDSKAEALFERIKSQAGKRIQAQQLHGSVLEVDAQAVNSSLIVKTRASSVHAHNPDALRISIEEDALKIIRAGFTFPEIQEVSVWTVTDLADSSGQKSEGKVFSVDAAREIHAKINYDAVSDKRAIGLFDPWYHQALR